MTIIGSMLRKVFVRENWIEFWWDLKTANPKTWEIRRSQVAAIAALFALIIGLITGNIGLAKYGSLIPATASFVSAVAHYGGKFFRSKMKNRDRIQQVNKH